MKGTEKQSLPAETVPCEGDDLIYMFPKKFERQVEVLLFVASAPAIPGKKHDLGSSERLEFAVSYIGEHWAGSHAAPHSSCCTARAATTPPSPT